MQVMFKIRSMLQPLATHDRPQGRTTMGQGPDLGLRTRRTGKTQMDLCALKKNREPITS